MRHDWERAGMCSYCGWFCRFCNDCKCSFKGWKLYAVARCPRFDTHAGRLRPWSLHHPKRKAQHVWRAYP